MKKAQLLVLALIVVLLVAVSSVAAGPNQRNFRAHLDGDAQVPPADTLSQGEAIFQFSLDGSEMRYRLITAGINDVFMAHIHLAPAGTNGPVAVWLYPSAPPPQPIPGRFDGVLAEGTVTEADLVGPLAGGTLADLAAEITAGNAYVNVHTAALPGGELRGQIQ